MRAGKGTMPLCKPLRTFRDLRNEMGLRIEDVAYLGKMSIGTYQKIDSGAVSVDNMSLNTFIHVAHGLKRTPCELLQDLGLDIKPDNVD